MSGSPNWRYLIGSQAHVALDAVLSSQRVPLTRYFPRGKYWMYDAQRFAGTRHFDVIFDVGANVGQTASDLVRYFPKAQIYCFEPVSSTFDILASKFGTQTNVRCVRQALGSRKGSREIELHENSELNSLMPQGGGRDGDLTGARELIEVGTLDDFCDGESIDAIDALKMDAQGMELDIINGGCAMLRKNAVRFVYAEIGFSRHDTDIQYFGDFNEALYDAGFILCGFYDPVRWGGAKQFMAFANALYINPSWTGA